MQAGSGLSVGYGWYASENSDGRPFRWAANDAAIVISRPQGDVKKISIEIQGGPGLANAQNFALHLRDASNDDVALVHVLGTQKVRFDVPVRAGKDKIVKLHVDGGGKKVAKDPRTLNFRVFSIADASGDPTLGAGHPDIVSSPLKLGDRWYPLEEFKGETFRWSSNDSSFTVVSSKDQQRELKVEAAGGPAVKNPQNWKLVLEDATGKVVQAKPISARGVAPFAVSLHSGSNAFKLHVDSTGTKAPKDPRTLDFRVFNIALE